MTNINVVYEYYYDDVDIIAIPDELIDIIEDIGQEFLHWAPPINDKDYWSMVDGRLCQNMNTDGFIKWLNSTYCKTLEKAYIVSRNTDYCPEYKMVDF